ncbi:MAG: hypothetical protein AAB815_00880 [Patescibacteria group bacterium]
MPKFKLQEFNDLAEGVKEAARQAVGSVTKTGVSGGVYLYGQRMKVLKEIYKQRNQPEDERQERR